MGYTLRHMSRTLKFLTIWNLYINICYMHPDTLKQNIYFEKVFVWKRAGGYISAVAHIQRIAKAQD